MKVDLFDFTLPEKSIAQYPISPRDMAKMLVVSNKGVFSDCHITNLPDFLEKDDIIVFNDTKVIPARLYGKRGEASIEATLFKRLEREKETWECLVKNSKRLKRGDIVEFSSDFKASVLEKGHVTILEFNVSGANFMENLCTYGTMPIPPYIRKGHSGKEDTLDYQTVYARYEGAVAAPTAGLHFTPELMATMENKGVKFTFLTLHVGGGTFLPVKAEDTDNHVMHAEFGIISKEAAEAINTAKRRGNKILCVGTTSLRLLESAATEDGIVHPFRDYTDIFITPGYRFKVPDMLMTNFHLPKSTLFMLVSAFAGLQEMKEAYEHAIANGYRFYSYGDSSLLFKKD